LPASDHPAKSAFETAFFAPAACRAWLDLRQGSLTSGRPPRSSAGSEEFNSTRQFPKWEHPACLTTIPVRIRIIKTKAEYEAALARIEKLMDAAPNTAQGDELELLSLLVHDYEEKKFPIDKPDPVAAIRFRMEQQGLAPRDLVPLLGSRSRVSEVLSGRRSLSLKMIRALVAGLRIPAELLLGEPGRA
jgi:antitoxin component HigA of HigAB toxin-antitoxin module